MVENGLLDAALSYVARGWHVFPLHSWSGGHCTCGREDCERAAKHPRTQNGLKDATTDPDQIRRWWEVWPDANIGLVTGTISGLVVVDADGERGKAMIRALDLPATPLVETGRGLHAYFAHPGHTVQNQQRGGWFSARYPGLDLRGDGGYVVAPPSVHATGALYRWHPALGPGQVALAPCPQIVEQNGAAPKGPAPPLPDKIPQGERHRHLLSLAGSMRRRGAGVVEILAALSAVNAARCDPPYPESRLRALAEDLAGRYPAGTLSPPPDGGGALPEEIKGPDGFALTDSGNAERFVGAHGAEVRHVKVWGKWLVWRGGRWVKDEVGVVVRRLLGVVRSLYARAADIPDSAAKKKWVSHLHTSESRPRLESALKIAESLAPVAVPHTIFDADPNRLNCRNGTLDLGTGRLLPHDPADHCTKQVAADYDAGATCPLWTSFLERVQPDPEVRAYLRRAVGYSLTGEVGEHILFFCWGTGANGKSTFLNAISAVMGDYAGRGAPGLLVAQKHEQHPAERAELFGLRFVVMGEPGAGEKLAEAKVKDLTGGDRVKARYLHQQFFEFEPSFKLWVAGNYKPVIRGDDEGIWRRVHLVPWPVTIPEAERDRGLDARLRAEAAGILRWAVEGCAEWRSGGLRPPAAVVAAVSDYREDTKGAVDGWLAERCERGADYAAPVADLYADYRAWCEAAHEEPWSRRGFALGLGDRGFRTAKSGSVRLRRGLRLAGAADITEVGALGTDNSGFQVTALTRARVGEKHSDLESSVPIQPADGDFVKHQSVPITEWLTESIPSFTADRDGRIITISGRGPNGRLLAGEALPATTPAANRAALRARGALTPHPPPPEAALCPRCGSTWVWGGVRGWVWGCCGQPVGP